MSNSSIGSEDLIMHMEKFLKNYHVTYLHLCRTTQSKYAYNSIKMFYNKLKRFWNIVYIFTCRYFIQIIPIKEKE